MLYELRLLFKELIEFALGIEFKEGMELRLFWFCRVLLCVGLRPGLIYMPMGEGVEVGCWLRPDRLPWGWECITEGF